MPDPEGQEATATRWADRLAHHVKCGDESIEITPHEYRELQKVRPDLLDAYLMSLLERHEWGRELRLVVRFPPSLSTIRLTLENP